MEGYPHVQATTTMNLQDTAAQPQKSPIMSNVNGNQLQPPYCTGSLVPPLALPAPPNHCEAIAGISNTRPGSVGDRAYSFAPGVLPACAEIYHPSPHSTPIAACSFSQSFVPPTTQISHFGGGLEPVYHATAHPASVLNPQHVLDRPVPITEPLMSSVACTLNDTASNKPHTDLPPVPVPTLLQPDKCVEGASRSVENLADSVGVPSVKETSNKAEQKQIRVEIEDPKRISATECNEPPVGEPVLEDISRNVAVSTENSAVQNINTSPLSESGKIENNGLDASNSVENPLPGALKSTVEEGETPKKDCDGKNPVEERGKSEGMVLPDKSKSTIVEPDPSNGKCDGKPPAKDCDKEHLSDAPVTQQVPDDVSCLLKNAVLVQALSFEPVEPVEDVKPVVGGSIDDIGRVDESQENIAIEPAELFVDETGDGPDYDAMDGVEVAKIDPIVPLEVPFFDSSEITDNVDAGQDKDGMVVAAGSESEDEPDMTECGEMIGLSTDDEIKLKRSMCAQTVSRAKKESIESQSKRGVSIDKDEDKIENGTKCGSDKKSRIPLDKRHTKKRKIHSIRIVDIKKEVLNIDEQNSEDSSENYASNIIKTKTRKQASSCSDAPYGSGFDSSCEEILDDDCLHDGLETESKRRSNSVAPRVNKRKEKKVEVIAGLKLPAHQQQQLQNLVLKKKQTTRDRFYDRSQDIPNDIYFENMNVPLHILHDTSSSASDEENSAVSKSRITNYSSHRNRHSSSSIGRSETNHKSLQSMKMFLKIAGFRHVRYQKLWKDCHTNQERAEAILRFLQDSGLQGEPTFEKCSELRKQIQLENEAKALDVSVIISAGEGRVTRQRTKMLTNTSTPATSERQKNIETEQLQTPQESASQSGDGHAQCSGEQNAEIGQPQTVHQDTVQPEDELTQCHNNDDIEKGQRQTVQQSASHSEAEPTKSHIEQASNVPAETKATEGTSEVDKSEKNQVLVSEQ
uniref:Uncharacterized protein n=1 Tax=Anopheles atroparvus TaxID=41427 RepID=A0AAG5CNY4_ANOAO